MCIFVGKPHYYGGRVAATETRLSFFFLKNYLFTTASLSTVFSPAPSFLHFFLLVFYTPLQYVMYLRAAVSDEKMDTTVAAYSEYCNI